LYVLPHNWHSCCLASPASGKISQKTSQLNIFRGKPENNDHYIQRPTIVLHHQRIKYEIMWEFWKYRREKWTVHKEEKETITAAPIIQQGSNITFCFMEMLT
jgi:hypothetical protein